MPLFDFMLVAIVTERIGREREVRYEYIYEFMFSVINSNDSIYKYSITVSVQFSAC